MVGWWQNLYGYVDPIAFTVGFFSVHWYALFWIFGFVSIWYVSKRWQKRFNTLTEKEWEDALLGVFIGALLGGHVGYGLLYQPELFFTDPIQFFSPYHFETETWIGIRGMSFYGGLIGVGIALFFQARRMQKDFLVLADFASLLAPLGLFFGRLGNFLNQELPGRLTTLPWGIYFPEVSPVGMLRHPSSLYEALNEGVILFLLLWFVSRRSLLPGGLTAFFLLGYGLLRFCGEYLRELDPGSTLFFGSFTFGQLLSMMSILSGVILLFWLRQKSRGTIGK